MGSIMKISGISPLNPTGLENRPETGRQKTSGKAYLSESGKTFDEYLEAQLKDRDFASHLNKTGQQGAVVLKKTSVSVAEQYFSLSLNDIIPELHIPFSREAS